jgi:hypothetical protein
MRDRRCEMRDMRCDICGPRFAIGDVGSAIRNSKFQIRNPLSLYEVTIGFAWSLHGVRTALHHSNSMQTSFTAHSIHIETPWDNLFLEKTGAA